MISNMNILNVMWVCIQIIFNTLRPRRNGHHFSDDILKCIFFDENVWISIKFSLKFVPKGPINNIPALVQIMAWRRPGDKPLSGAMTVNLPTHIHVTQPQWVNKCRCSILLQINLMARCKNMVTPVHLQLSYHSLGLSHWYKTFWMIDIVHIHLLHWTVLQMQRKHKILIFIVCFSWDIISMGLCKKT